MLTNGGSLLQHNNLFTVAVIDKSDIFMIGKNTRSYIHLNIYMQINFCHDMEETISEQKRKEEEISS